MREILEKLAAAGIEAAPLPGIERYALCARGEYGALVSVGPEGFGRVGSSGLIVPQGLAMLVWRGESAVFVWKGGECPATAEHVEGLRVFMAEVEGVLAGK